MEGDRSRSPAQEYQDHLRVPPRESAEDDRLAVSQADGGTQQLSLALRYLYLELSLPSRTVDLIGPHAESPDRGWHGYRLGANQDIVVENQAAAKRTDNVLKPRTYTGAFV